MGKAQCFMKGNSFMSRNSTLANPLVIGGQGTIPIVIPPLFH